MHYGLSGFENTSLGLQIQIHELKKCLTLKQSCTHYTNDNTETIWVSFACRWDGEVRLLRSVVAIAFSSIVDVISAFSRDSFSCTRSGVD